MQKDTTYSINRNELIKMARESCEGNLKASGNGRFSYGITKKTNVNGKTAKASTSKGYAISTTEAKKQMSFKLLLIRTICAAAIFLAIVLIDKLNFSYQTFNSDQIIDTVQSNVVAQEAEKLLSSISDGKIIEVFNGLK